MMNRIHVLTFMVVLVLGALAQAQTFTTLYNFEGSDGGNSYAAIIQDTEDNLYTTASYGGAYAPYGVVLKLDRAGTETVLHSFDYLDGAYSYSPLTRDSMGNLYGTASAGGPTNNSNLGNVFKIDTAGNYTIVHNFAGGTSDGCSPWQGVIRDKAGSLYGTTYGCGSFGHGTIFKIDSTGKETILYNFAGGSSDGASPAFGHLLMDKVGNLYGSTTEGGAGSSGVLYKLTAKGKETLLYSFKGQPDGTNPGGTVAMDKDGNVYGTAYLGGASNGGIVWKVSKRGKETILHNFAGSDGCIVVAGVVRDSKGNLYGNAQACGPKKFGTVWELSTKGKLTMLHSFARTDGSCPSGEVLRTRSGQLLGTTTYGGSHNFGTVWSYVP